MGSGLTRQFQENQLKFCLQILSFYQIETLHEDSYINKVHSRNRSDSMIRSSIERHHAFIQI